jgi:hypothetical protein
MSGRLRVCIAALATAVVAGGGAAIATAATGNSSSGGTTTTQSQPAQPNQGNSSQSRECPNM